VKAAPRQGSLPRAFTKKDTGNNEKEKPLNWLKFIEVAAAKRPALGWHRGHYAPQLPGAAADPKRKKIKKPDGKVEKKAEKRAEKIKLSGAELYSMHCQAGATRRYPTERTAAQWKPSCSTCASGDYFPANSARTVLVPSMTFQTTARPMRPSNRDSA